MRPPGTLFGLAALGIIIAQQYVMLEQRGRMAELHTKYRKGLSDCLNVAEEVRETTKAILRGDRPEWRRFQNGEPTEWEQYMRDEREERIQSMRGEAPEGEQ